MSEDIEATPEEIVETPEAVVEAPPVEVAPEVEVDPEVADEARKYGWRPKEEFDLDPEGWVDADRFLELPSTQRKQLKDINRNLEAEIGKLKSSNETTAREAAKAAKIAIEQAEKRHEAELMSVRAAQRKAAEDGDIAAYDIAEQKVQALQSQKPVADDPQPQQRSAEFEAYRQSADWVKDPIMWNVAVQAVSAGGDAVMSMSDIEQLKYAETKVKEYFPDKFAPPKPRVQRVDGGGIGAAKATKGVNALPPEARAAAKEFVEEGVYESMDDYAKAYFKHLDGGN